MRHTAKRQTRLGALCAAMGLGLALAAHCVAATAQPRHINETDLFSFVWLGDPQISPDAHEVAFVRVTANEKREDYDTSIWTVSLQGHDTPHELTQGKHDAAPRWSPDGRALAFVRASEKDGKPQPGQLWILPAQGEPFALTDLPKGISKPVWSPDGTKIAFLSRTNSDDIAKQERAKDASKGHAANERESDVRIIARAVYRSNDTGYLDPKHPDHIWIVQIASTADQKAEPRQLTNGPFSDDNVFWAPDGEHLYFTSDHAEEPYYETARTDLYALTLRGGAPQKLAPIELDAHSFAPSPDGKRVAFIAESTHPVRSYSQPDLWILDLTPQARPRNLTVQFDWDIAAPVAGDNAAPRAAGDSPPVWTADGTSIIESYSREGRTNLAFFNAMSGVESDITAEAQSVLAFRASADAGVLIYVASSPTKIGDLFVLRRSAPNVRPLALTHFNDELFAQLDLKAPEEFWYRSFDGKRVQAWLQKPPDFDAGKKYPLILDIHGGPHTAYGQVFDHEFQWMAARGYLVLYPNPRGSTSYGQAFGNVIQYHYPGDDYRDLMAGVDAVVQRGYVDVKKLGVTGGSGGGLLTNWVVGHTTRFAAAVAQRDIASWADWWYTADITLFNPNWFRAPPFEDPSDYTARSPITYIRNVTTPMMFVLGESDSRTPPEAGGDQMFRALKYRHIPAVMVRFPGETHELSRSGSPWHRVERLQHIVGWFDHWLRGEPKPEYEVATAR
jgi:dipeptidyl aminopeptidase/acylaminoacyl peptidase